MTKVFKKFKTILLLAVAFFSVQFGNASAVYQTVSCQTNNDCANQAYPECMYIESIQGSVCSLPGDKDFCTLDSDCRILGRTDCLESSGGRSKLTTDQASEVQSSASNAVNSDEPTTIDGFGVCGIQIATSESNVMVDALCNLFRFATGQTGRLILGIVVVVIGIMFYLGKVSWGTVAATAIGAGAMFGSSTIVSVLAGKGFTC